MNAEINVKACEGDKVWLAFKGGPYKATVLTAITHIRHFSDWRYGVTEYYVQLEDGSKFNAYGVSIFHTKKEAQQRLRHIAKLGDGTKELRDFVVEEKEKNPDVKFIDQEQGFKEFVSLVKQMRKAQKKFGGEVDVCVGFEEGLDEMYRLEDRVDEYLKKM